MKQEVGIVSQRVTPAGNGGACCLTLGYVGSAQLLQHIQPVNFRPSLSDPAVFNTIDFNQFDGDRFPCCRNTPKFSPVSLGQGEASGNSVAYGYQVLHGHLLIGKGLIGLLAIEDETFRARW